MWTHIDESGAEWDVVLGRESWGALLALFIPRGRGDEARTVRQAVLQASGYEDAQREVEALGASGLAELFRRSNAKES